MFLVSAAGFVSLTLLAGFAGVPSWERALYESIAPSTQEGRTIFRWITWLGSQSVLIRLSILLVFALPDQLLRRWWLWVAVMLVSSLVEGFAKPMIGRPRPESLRPGFPSAHATAATAFFSMAAYLAAKVLKVAGARVAVWAVAVLAMLAVAVSRIVLHVHWPLDTLGGAALGLTCLASAAWWNERYPIGAAGPPGVAWTYVQTWVYQWREAVPIPFYFVLFLTPPMIGGHSTLALIVEIVGILVIAGGLALRGWAAGAQRGIVADGPSAGRFVVSGPFRLMRHPVYAGNVMIAIGIMLMAKNGLGLVVIPAVLFGAYRLIAPIEEAHLRHRFGPAFDEYCRHVARWLPRRGIVSAPLSRPFAWSSVKNELPAAAMAGAMAILAEISEIMPHPFG